MELGDTNIFPFFPIVNIVNPFSHCKPTINPQPLGVRQPNPSVRFFSCGPPDQMSSEGGQRALDRPPNVPPEPPWVPSGKRLQFAIENGPVEIGMIYSLKIIKSGDFP